MIYYFTDNDDAIALHSVRIYAYIFVHDRCTPITSIIFLCFLLDTFAFVGAHFIFEYTLLRRFFYQNYPATARRPKNVTRDSYLSLLLFGASLIVLVRTHTHTREQQSTRSAFQLMQNTGGWLVRVLDDGRRSHLTTHVSRRWNEEIYREIWSWSIFRFARRVTKKRTEPGALTWLTILL